MIGEIGIRGLSDLRWIRPYKINITLAHTGVKCVIDVQY